VCNGDGDRSVEYARFVGKQSRFGGVLSLSSTEKKKKKKKKKGTLVSCSRARGKYARTCAVEPRGTFALCSEGARTSAVNIVPRRARRKHNVRS